jgi:hypothetical protein
LILLHEIAIHPDFIPNRLTPNAPCFHGPWDVLNNPEVLHDAAAQHGFQFFRGVVCSPRIDERDVLREKFSSQKRTTGSTRR